MIRMTGFFGNRKRGTLITYVYSVLKRVFRALVERSIGNDDWRYTVREARILMR